MIVTFLSTAIATLLLVPQQATAYVVPLNSIIVTTLVNQPCPCIPCDSICNSAQESETTTTNNVAGIVQYLPQTVITKVTVLPGVVFQTDECVEEPPIAIDSTYVPDTTYYTSAVETDVPIETPKPTTTNEIPSTGTRSIDDNGSSQITLQQTVPDGIISSDTPKEETQETNEITTVIFSVIPPDDQNIEDLGLTGLLPPNIRSVNHDKVISGTRKETTTGSIQKLPGPNGLFDGKQLPQVIEDRLITEKVTEIIPYSEVTHLTLHEAAKENTIADVLSSAAGLTLPIDISGVPTDPTTPIGVSSLAAGSTSTDVLDIATASSPPIDVSSLAAGSTPPIGVSNLAADSTPPVDVSSPGAASTAPTDILSLAAGDQQQPTPTTGETNNDILVKREDDSDGKKLDVMLQAYEAYAKYNR